MGSKVYTNPFHLLFKQKRDISNLCVNMFLYRKVALIPVKCRTTTRNVFFRSLVRWSHCKYFMVDMYGLNLLFVTWIICTFQSKQNCCMFKCLLFTFKSSTYYMWVLGLLWRNSWRAEISKWWWLIQF